MTVWFLGRLVARSAIGASAGVLVLLLPLPSGANLQWHMVRAGLGAILIVCSIGKALYDTLFYDRYWP